MAPSSWILVWEVPLGNGRRLESSHLRCTWLPAASASASPKSRSDGRGEKRRWKQWGEWDMKVEVVQGARETERGRCRVSLFPSVLWSETTLWMKFALAACLLFISPCLIFDSRFTVLVSSLAFIPQILNNITTRSVKPLWWSNTSEEVICDMCDIQSPLLSCLLVQSGPQMTWLLLCKARRFLQKLERLKDSRLEQEQLIKVLQLSTTFLFSPLGPLYKTPAITDPCHGLSGLYWIQPFQILLKVSSAFISSLNLVSAFQLLFTLTQHCI